MVTARPQHPDPSILSPFWPLPPQGLVLTQNVFAPESRHLTAWPQLSHGHSVLDCGPLRSLLSAHPWLPHLAWTPRPAHQCNHSKARPMFPAFGSSNMGPPTPDPQQPSGPLDSGALQERPSCCLHRYPVCQASGAPACPSLASGRSASILFNSCSDYLAPQAPPHSSTFFSLSGTSCSLFIEEPAPPTKISSCDCPSN